MGIISHYKDPFLNNQYFMESKTVFIFFRGSIGMPGKGALKDGQLLHVLGSADSPRRHLPHFLNHPGVDVRVELNCPQDKHI